MKYVFAIAGVGALALGVLLFFMAIGWYNDAIAKQEGVKAQYRDNGNVHDAFWKTVQENAQVPAQYKEDMKDLLATETTAKYGENGSQATVQWFRDRNIQLSDQLYVKLMNIIESGRNDFKRGQTLLLDKQRAFSVYTKTFWGKLLGDAWGVPAVVEGPLAPPRDLDGDGKLTVLDYPIVLSAKTNKAFATGEDEALDVFNKER
jgi:hypothetical protein